MSTNDYAEAISQLQKLQCDYPSERFAVRNLSAKRTVGIAVAQELGLSILEQIGKWQAVVVYPEFAVVSVRTCKRCGGSYDTIAIGEKDNNLCPACDQLRAVELDSELRSRIQEANVEKADWEWRDEWEE